MNRIHRLVHEAHRRSMWQVFGVYVAVSWGIYQIVKELSDLFGLPDWVPGFGIVLLLIGLPIVLATAFVQEGVRKTPEPDPIDPTLMPMMEGVAPQATPSTPAHRDVFTWQKAVLGGIVAFLLLGITAGGYMGLRNAGVGPFGSLLASGALDEREPILIAEFAPLNGDSMLATAVTEAFRLDFAQSTSITVVEPSHVRRVLQRMSRPATSRVDADLAHEIAVRDNIKAYITGEISKAGSKYIIAAKLISTNDRQVLQPARETADSEDDIIAAVDRLSRKLRSKIGDSYKTIRQERPLEAVSTPSLEALQKYTQAINVMDTDADFETGITLLLEAVELDSAFAMAWRKLGAAYSNTAQGREAQVHATMKAYQYRERLPDVERYKTIAYYHSTVTQDWTKSINAYRMVEEQDPTYPPNNIGIMYQNVREYDKAEAAFRRSMAKDSLLSNAWRNLATQKVFLGEFEKAEQIVKEGERRFGKHPGYEYIRARGLAAQHKYPAAEAFVRKNMEETRGNQLFNLIFHYAMHALTTAQGHMAASDRHADEMIAREKERGVVAGPLNVLLHNAALDLNLRRDPKQAIATLEAALRTYPLNSLPRLDRPHLEVAALYAHAGDNARAREHVAMFESEVPTELRGDPRQSYDVVNGTIALNEGRFDEAIAHWRRASDVGACISCMDPYVGRAFEQAGMADSAIARYRRFIDAPTPMEVAALHRASTLERLADLYAARGDQQNAALYAGKFVELWQTADAELQPRVSAKREMLRQLGRN